MPLVIRLMHPDSERRAALGRRIEGAGYALVDDASRADVLVIAAALPSGERERLVGRAPGAPVIVLGGEGEGLLTQLTALEQAATPRLRLGEALVDVARRAVFRGGRQQTLTEKEASLLAWLVARAGQIASRGELLENVWGYHPDTATRTVDITVRRLRSKIEADPSAPLYVQTARGEGYRFVAPHAGSQPPGAARADPAPAPAIPPPRGATSTASLPALPPRFRGRGAALSQLEGLLEAGRVVTLLGPAGVGKTSLALAAARAAERALFCDLSAAGSAAAVIEGVAESLGLPMDGLGAAAVGRALAHRGRAGGLLVVLDNFEQITAWAAETVGVWARAAPPVRFLVTSRTRLRLPGEVCLDLEPLSDEHAASLLLDAARARSPDFGRAPGDDRRVRAVAARLEGIPLAIELAAGRARLLSAAELQLRLERSLDLLKDERRPSRQASLAGALAWSWELLDESDRRALIALSVFRGGFTLAAVSSGEVGGEADAMDQLERLLDSSLARTAPPAAGVMRFSLYQAVREYAARRASPEALAEARRAHARWFARVGAARAAAADGPDGWDIVAAMAADRANTLVAAERSLATDPPLAAALLSGLAPLWETRGASEDDRARLLAAASGGLVGQSADTLRGVVLALTGGGDGALAAAASMGERCLALAREDGDPALVARCAAAAGRALFEVGRHDRAQALLEEARGLSEGAPQTAVRALLGLIDLARARHLDDGPLLEEAFRLARENNLSRLKGELRRRLALSHIRGGRYSDALGLLEAVLATCRAGGDQRGTARTLLHIGAAYAYACRYPESLAAHAEGREVFLALGDSQMVAYAEYQQGWTLSDADDFEGALPALRSAIRRADEVGAAMIGAMARNALANTLLMMNRPQEVATILGPALATFEALENAHNHSRALVYRGRAALRLGRAAEAAGDLLAALGGDDAIEALVRPREDGAQFFLGLAWYLMGGAARALALSLASPRTINPFMDAVNIGWQGFLLAEAGRLDEAREAFADAREARHADIRDAQEVDLSGLELRLRMAEGLSAGDAQRAFDGLSSELSPGIEPILRAMLDRALQA